MELVGSESFDLDLGRRMIVIISFLAFLWLGLNYFVAKIKSGEMELPGFLKKAMPGLDKIKIEEKHKISLVQRKILPEGTEMMVVEVDGQKILLAKTINTGITYIKDMN